MRVDSASVAKGRREQSSHLVPREGSKLRELYDLLMAHKGEPVMVALTQVYDGRRIAMLQDFYGLDIRNLNYGCWVLAGEWFGTTYLDYIADRLNEAAE